MLLSVALLLISAVTMVIKGQGNCDDHTCLNYCCNVHHHHHQDIDCSNCADCCSMLPIVYSDWSQCSLECGGGIQYRYCIQNCAHSHIAEEPRSCNLQPCQPTKLQRDCLALLETGWTQSGVYNISVTGTSTTSVWCDMETDGGGWTVFQRRIDGTTDFYRGWNEYRDGFGDVNHEYWLGNEHLHALLLGGENELRVDMEDFESNTAYAKYNHFDIGDAANKYRLDISGFSGNEGDSMKRHNGHLFTTKDQNNGNPVNCAIKYHGAWWYNVCHDTNLNGLYLSGHTSSYANGIVWVSWKGYHYSLKSTKMMFRRLVTA